MAAAQLVQELPQLIHSAQAWISGSPSRCPALVTDEQIPALNGSQSINIGALRQALFSRSVKAGASASYRKTGPLLRRVWIDVNL